MKQIIEALRELTGENAYIEPYNGKAQLSLYLSSAYQLFLIKILNVEFLLVEPLEMGKLPQLEAHLRQFTEIFGYEAVLLAKQLTPYKRKKLISARIPFICSDKQLFLPFLGIHLQNRFQKTDYKLPEEKFTPSMQLIYLFILYSNDSVITQEQISRKLGISPMTVSRTLDRFVQLNLLDYSIGGKTGRKKIYHCIDKKMYYYNGKNHLINPVLERFFVKKVPKNIKKYISGLSALSEKTLLGAPDNQIIAISQREESLLLPYQVSWETGLEEQLTEVEVMKYDIGLLTNDQYIDVVSMIYSMKEHDDRIDIAIDEAMEGYSWYVD